MALNEDKLNQLLGRFVDDFGAVFHGAMVVIGDNLGLYKALAEAGPLTSKELAEREQAFRTGEGVGWHEHDPELFRGTERFFRPGYAANLMSSSIPSLDAVEEKLKAGARVADLDSAWLFFDKRRYWPVGRMQRWSE